MCVSRLIWKFFKKALFLEGTGTPYSHSLISLPFVPVLYPPSFIASSSLVCTFMLTLKKKYSSHPSIASIQKVSQKTWHTKHSFLHNCDLDKNRNIELNIFVLFVSKDTLRKVRKCWEKICIVSRGEMLINISKMHGNMFPYCIKRRNADKH